MTQSKIPGDFGYYPAITTKEQLRERARLALGDLTNERQFLFLGLSSLVDNGLYHYATNFVDVYVSQERLAWIKIYAATQNRNHGDFLPVECHSRTRGDYLMWRGCNIYYGETPVDDLHSVMSGRLGVLSSAKTFMLVRKELDQERGVKNGQYDYPLSYIKPLLAVAEAGFELSENELTFIRKYQNHDDTYWASDDSAAYRRGAQSQEWLERAVKMQPDWLRMLTVLDYVAQYRKLDLGQADFTKKETA